MFHSEKQLDQKHRLYHQNCILTAKSMKILKQLNFDSVRIIKCHVPQQYQANNKMKNILEPSEPSFQTLIEPPQQQKIPALPLQFEHLPVQLLSKEFTKLNSHHIYRIHYLGPRPIHTLALHRRYAFNEKQPAESAKFKQQQSNKGYPAPLRRIVNCNYINEKLRDNHHYRSSFFYRAFEGMNPTLSSSQIVFNSAFQSGNLDCVIKVAAEQYDLFLRIDSNTRGHTNWYYFSVKNKKIFGSPVKFNICNLSKVPGLYDQGFRPFVYSKKGNELRGDQWQQKGEQVQLEPANLRYGVLGSKGDNFFKLSFCFTFEFQDDQVFFAYCIPYKYSDLHHDINVWKQSEFVLKTCLGRSLSGLQLPLLHVSDHYQKGGFCGSRKKNIVVIGRAHPAETCGSYVLKGFLNWLVGSSSQAAQLRKKTNFFIVPMLNPDGVILGNSRTSGAGKDLNRQFLSVRRDLYPEVYLVKTLIARLQKKFGVLLFLDFHGHSKKKNTFFYGPSYPISHRQYYKCRVLPRLIQRINPSFRFYSCSFQISQAKRSTARAVTFTQLRVPYSFTIQSSVGLYYNPQTMKTINFNLQDWLQMGKNICQGITQFILGLQELQYSVKERRIQRQKVKQSKVKGKQTIIQEKQRKKPLLFDLIQQVKMISSKLVHEDEVESDQHDSSQGLQAYQLSQFNQLVVSGRQRQRKTQGKEVQQKEESYQFPLIQQQENQQIPFTQQPPKQMKTQSIKANRSLQPRTNWPKIFSGIRQVQSRNMTKSTTRGISTPNLSNLYTSQKKPVVQNKKRSNLTHRNYFPEDRCQILSFPKNDLTKREKPTWRLNGELIAQIATRKGISSITDKIRIGKSSSIVNDLSAYQFINAFQMDNRAMTIKTFKKR